MEGPGESRMSLLCSPMRYYRTHVLGRRVMFRTSLSGSDHYSHLWGGLYVIDDDFNTPLLFNEIRIDLNTDIFSVDLT